ncbi:replication restart helicase PriA [Robertkochia aurantiaca]|uniref:replication restart helicase PriA n=1 Tax=Robertkochia aurantiaca TaxID=2873700 RepID=UPI001CC98259|nr:primosomal protein N' [Robertkochia sp. 3YJGBD-33]
MSFFADVILPIPLEKQFTYLLTPEQADLLQEGMRVAVPFGKSKVYTGLVYRVHRQPPQVYDAKPIDQVLDETPLVTERQLRHWEWLADYYMCSLGDVFRAALPSSLLLESETLVCKAGDFEGDESDLSDEEWLVLEALQHQPQLKVHEVGAVIDRKNVLPVLKRLIEKGVVELKEEVVEQYKPKKVRYIRLMPDYEKEEALQTLLDDLSRAPRQREVLLTLYRLEAVDQKPVRTTELEKESGASSAILRTMIDKGILEDYYLEIDRLQGTEADAGALFELNEFQQQAFEEIEQAFQFKDTVLLHGVTSSGKTEVYFKLIDRALEQQKQVLFLVPEIALTTQLIKRLERRFGTKVSVFHSRYSSNERVEVWHAVKDRDEKARIVVGARSAVLLPFSDLGLVVVDEEHETSYKQFEPAPRYHGRDSAIVLAAIHGAKTLLGSATPSVESYYNARTGKYGLVQITRRFGNVLMPDMEICDIKDAHRRKKMQGHFSERLTEAIRECLDEGEQVILFQNRRGFAPILECNTCGHSPQCPNCDVSLTFHKYKNQLRCHYCGHHMAMQLSCLACGSSELDTKGFGTEQIEAEAKELFPGAKTGRMDSDSTRGKHGYEKIISAFEQQEYDILVGTQMITKGLDFRNVTLVGILQADTMLNFPDFRAHERSFQLIQQVAGRAGRTRKRGKVIIQSFNPHHQILQQASTNSYEEMFEDQMNERRQFHYPPVYKMIKFVFKGRDYNRVNEAADWYAGALRNTFLSSGGFEVLGPEFPPVARIRNRYHKHAILKIGPGVSLKQTKAVLKKIGKSYTAIANFRSVRLINDVDNY